MPGTRFFFCSNGSVTYLCSMPCRESLGWREGQLFLVSGQRHFIRTNVELFSFWGGHLPDQSARLDLVHRELLVHSLELNSPIGVRERRCIPPSLECSLVILRRGTVQERKAERVRAAQWLDGGGVFRGGNNNLKFGEFPFLFLASSLDNIFPWMALKNAPVMPPCCSFCWSSTSPHDTLPKQDIAEDYGTGSS